MIKYLLFQSKVPRGEIFDLFKDYATDSSLEILFMKFQHNADIRESYFFCIAVVVDENTDNIPDNVKNLLNTIRSRNENCKHRQIIRNEVNYGGRLFFQENQMNFLRDKTDFLSFKNQVIFEKYERNRRGDFINGIPVAFESMGTGDDNEHYDELCNDIHVTENAPVQDDDRMNLLLWWSSAKGEGSFQGFKEACNIFELTVPGDGKAWYFMRRLILLGHIEAVEEGNKFIWGVTPTALVQPVIGDLYVTGVMTPFSERSLSEKVTINKTTSNGGPARISIQDLNEARSSGFTIIQDPAGKLANALPCFKEWQDSLVIDPDILPHRYSLKIFNGKSFVELNEGPPSIGLYEATRIDGEHNKPSLCFYDGVRWKRGGYYDLRWLGIKYINPNMTVWLDKNGSLTLPEIGRWPLLYERALVLASGKLPRRGKVNGIDALIYDSVDLGLAKVLTEKLEVKMEEI